MKNRNYQLLLGILVLSVLVISFVIFTQPSEKGDRYEENETWKESNGVVESYPEHPALAACEKLVYKKNFCIADAAEIKNNLSLCEMINDTDVKNFCIARILLNESLCENINEIGLKKACLESIEMKREWL